LKLSDFFATLKQDGRFWRALEKYIYYELVILGAAGQYACVNPVFRCTASAVT